MKGVEAFLGSPPCEGAGGSDSSSADVLEPNLNRSNS